MLCIEIKLTFIIIKTITKGFGYKIKAYGYTTKGCGCKTEAFGYNSNYGQSNLSFYTKHIFF